MPLPILDSSLAFPEAHFALDEPNGLLAIGGDLSVERLLLAYQQGIFPWFSDDEPIMWWSPNPRAVLLPTQFHISRSFNKFLKNSDYELTLNYDFAAVIQQCARVHSSNHGGTWITDDMIDAYVQLHQLGFAHCVEVWQNSQLIGGIYGIGLGQLFCGESMFSLQVNASKVALYGLTQHFLAHGGKLIDCQVLNAHTASLGAIEIARDEYLPVMKQLQLASIDPDCWHKQRIIY